MIITWSIAHSRHSPKSPEICFLKVLKLSLNHCRWLDESDGENGIEQELILSDIMVADEEEKQEDLPGIVMILSFQTVRPGKNRVEPDQTAARGAVSSGSTLFAIPSASFGFITLWKIHISQILG